MKELFRRFWLGICNTLGVAQVRRHVESPAESFDAVRADIHIATQTALGAEGAVELPRRHELEPRSWRLPNGTIIFDTVNQEAIELLKSDPDEYFRRTRRDDSFWRT